MALKHVTQAIQRHKKMVEKKVFSTIKLNSSHREN